MGDSATTVGELRRELAEFVRERDWEQFHAPKNLAMSLAIEAAELMEHFQWIDVGASRQAGTAPAARQAIADEVADVLAYLLALANAMNLDLSEAFRAKMERNRAKYPADEFRGRYGADAPRAVNAPGGDK